MKSLKNQLKDRLLNEVHRCYYCKGRLSIPRPEEGSPSSMKFKSYERTVLYSLVPRDRKTDFTDDGNWTLVHSWCKLALLRMTDQERSIHQERLANEPDFMVECPWIDKKRLKSYLNQGGSLAKLISRVSGAIDEPIL